MWRARHPHTNAQILPLAWKNTTSLTTATTAAASNIVTHTHTHRIHTSKLFLTCKSTVTFHAKQSHTLSQAVMIVSGKDDSTEVILCLQHAAAPHTHNLNVVTNHLRYSKVLISPLSPRGSCVWIPPHPQCLSLTEHTHIASAGLTHMILLMRQLQFALTLCV